MNLETFSFTAFLSSQISFNVTLSKSLKLLLKTYYREIVEH